MKRKLLALKRAAHKAAFIERVLKNEETGQPVRNNWHHLEWLKLSELHRLLLLEAAREHSKTSLEVVGDCLYEIGVSPNARILIISDVYEKSQARARVLKDYIERDEDYAAEFPGTEIAHKSGDEEFTVARDRILKEPTVTSTYAGAPISGYRYGLIIADDVVNLIKNSQTPVAREKLRRWWYRDVMNSLARGGKIRMLGTPQHSDDLHTVVENDKRFHVAKYPGVDEEDTGWGSLGYREKNEARGVTGKDAICLWPGMHSYAVHMDKKENQYDEYLSQQQLQSVPPGGLVYPRSLVDAALERGKIVEPDKNAAQFLGIDPGYAIRAAMLKIQETAGDRVEMWGEDSFTLRDPDYVAKIIAAHCKEWSVQGVYVDAEDPGFIAVIRREVRALGMSPKIVQGVPFAKWKRHAIKTTRWMLRGNRLSWKAEETLVHKPGRVSTEPSLFRSEVRDYAIKPGEDDMPAKGDDHGPDAFTAYAARWVPMWLKATDQDDEKED